MPGDMTDYLPPPPPDEWGPRLKLAAKVLALLGWAVAAVLAFREGKPVPPPPVVIEAAPAPAAAEPGDHTPTFGWVKDADAVDAAVKGAAIPAFGDTPAGKAALGDDDTFLWQVVRKVNNRGPPWYPNVNQGSVGCCVGCGYKHGVDVVQAVQILSGHPAGWKPVSVEAIYAASRVEIGGGRISGDGSIGAWAAAAVQKVGVLAMAPHGRHDLTAFSPARARQWGRSGVPDELEPEARKHPVKGAALVRTWPEVKKAVRQGYPVVVCSGQGFRMQRDAQGFAAPQGSWPHCMVILGVRSDRDGAFVLNSWGDRAHTGPAWPADMPTAGFWADAKVVERMVREGDSFALSDMTGFPSRRLDWFIRHAPKPADLLALAW